MVGGPAAAVAIADSGHGWHFGRGDDNDNDNRGSNSGSRGNLRGGSDWSDDNVNNGIRISTSDSDERPSTRVGSGRESGTSEERPSSDYSPASPQFKKPKVTFGDGRTPGVQDHDPEPRWGWSAPEPAPPPPPPPQVITVPLNPPTVRPIAPHPGVVKQLVVAPTAGIADPLWGVAGLLLIPAAGAILGYRQAKGAHAAAALGRHP
jgi:hypothetical protein